MSVHSPLRHTITLNLGSMTGLTFPLFFGFHGSMGAVVVRVKSHRIHLPFFVGRRWDLRHPSDLQKIGINVGSIAWCSCLGGFRTAYSLMLFLLVLRHLPLQETAPLIPSSTQKSNKWFFRFLILYFTVNLRLKSGRSGRPATVSWITTWNTRISDARRDLRFQKIILLPVVHNFLLVFVMQRMTIGNMKVKGDCSCLGFEWVSSLSAMMHTGMDTSFV